MAELTHAQRQVIWALAEIAQTGRTQIRYTTFLGYVDNEPDGGHEVYEFLSNMLRDIQLGHLHPSEDTLTARVKAIIDKHTPQPLDSEGRHKLLADFNEIGRRMNRTENREERINLSRHRSELAGYLDISGAYVNHCWECQGAISSVINARCPKCHLFMCNACGSCMCNRY